MALYLEESCHVSLILEVLFKFLGRVGGEGEWKHILCQSAAFTGLKMLLPC